MRSIKPEKMAAKATKAFVVQRERTRLIAAPKADIDNAMDIAAQDLINSMEAFGKKIASTVEFLNEADEQ